MVRIKKEKPIKRYIVPVDFIATYNIEVCAISVADAKREALDPHAIVLSKTIVNRKQRAKNPKVVKE